MNFLLWVVGIVLYFIKLLKTIGDKLIMINKKQFQELIALGEGQFIEFKKSLDKSFSKEITAFANASGGKIFLGVDDDYKIKGINITNRLKSQIQDIANKCDPSIFINLDSFDNVLIVEVKEGQNKPYSCKTGFYMRMGPNSQKMKRDDILKLAIKEGKIRFDEQICENFDWNDFDDEKFEYYLKLAGISNNLSREELLRNLKVFTDDGMTNAGVLFFAKTPYKYIITSKVRCVHFRGDKRIDILDKKEVDKGIIGNIEFAVNYIKELVPVRFEIKELARKEFPEYPDDAFREAIVNAIIHFDYFDGCEVAIEKLKSKIIINNKGELLFDERYFGIKSEPRNRLMADLLSKTEYMERVGTGIKRIKDTCCLNGNKVEFSFSDSFWVEIYSNRKTSQKPAKNQPKTSQKIFKEKRKRMIIKAIKEKRFTKRGFAEEIGMNKSTVESDLEELISEKKIVFIGSPKGGSWEIIKQ